MSATAPTASNTWRKTPEAVSALTPEQFDAWVDAHQMLAPRAPAPSGN